MRNLVNDSELGSSPTNDDEDDDWYNEEYFPIDEDSNRYNNDADHFDRSIAIVIFVSGAAFLTVWYGGLCYIYRGDPPCGHDRRHHWIGD